MRRESSWFVNSALISTIALGIGLPVLLILTTSWPLGVIIGADIIAVIGWWCQYGTGFQAGYRNRDELALDHAIEAVRIATSNHTEGI